MAVCSLWKREVAGSNPAFQTNACNKKYQASPVGCFGIALLYKTLPMGIRYLYAT